jgi:hypothetical protein
MPCWPSWNDPGPSPHRGPGTATRGCRARRPSSAGHPAPA